MAKTPSNEKYLLLLNYPACSLPIGLFETAEKALQYAALHPPPHADNLDGDSDLHIRFGNQYAAFEDYDRKENRAPQGYIIQKFIGDEPYEWAAVEPYAERTVAHPSDPEQEEKGNIDAEQELDWV